MTALDDLIDAKTPAARWTGADYTAGTWPDATGNGHTATLVGSATVVDGASTGAPDAVKLDGASYLTVPDAAAWDFAAGFTIEAWLRIDPDDLDIEAPASGWEIGARSVLSRDNTSTVKSWAAGLAGASYYRSGGGFAYGAEPTVAAGDRVQLVWVFDGQDVWAYVNGLQDYGRPLRGADPAIPQAVAASASGLTIGALLGGSRGFLTSAIEELVVYDDPLTAADVKAHAAAGHPAPILTEWRVAERIFEGPTGVYLGGNTRSREGTKVGDLMLVTFTAAEDVVPRPWSDANDNADRLTLIAVGPASPGTTDYPAGGLATESWPIRTWVYQRYVQADGETFTPYLTDLGTALSDDFDRAVVAGAIYRSTQGRRVQVAQVVFDTGAEVAGGAAASPSLTTGGGDRTVARFYSFVTADSVRPAVAASGGQVLRGIEDLYGEVARAAVVDEQADTAGAVTGRTLEVTNTGFEWSAVALELVDAATPDALGATGRIEITGQQPPGQAPDPSSELPEIPEDPDPDLTETAVYVALEDEGDVPDDTPVTETVYDDMGD